MNRFLLLPLLLLQAIIGKPCSCIPNPEQDFFRNALNSTYNCIAVLEEVRFDNPSIPKAHTATFRLVHAFNFSEQETGTKIYVVGQDGVNCNRSFQYFALGDTFALAVQKSMSHRLAKDTFDLTTCGTYYLDIKKSRINDGLTLAEIYNRLENLLTDIDRDTPSHLSTYPNPSQGLVNLHSNNIMYLVQVFDTQGKLLLEQSIPQLLQFSLDLTAWRGKDGLYELVIHTEKGRITRRVLL